jgi:hypothetical protein
MLAWQFMIIKANISEECYGLPELGYGFPWPSKPGETLDMFEQVVTSLERA